MRLRMPLLIVIALSACVDPLPIVSPERDVGDITSYTDEEAARKLIGILTDQLSNPQSLALNAFAHNRTVDQHRRSVEETIRTLQESLDAMADDANPHCSSDADFAVGLDGTRTAIEHWPGVWDFSCLFCKVVVTGFTVSTEPAKLRTSVYGEVGFGWPEPEDLPAGGGKSDTSSTGDECRSLDVAQVEYRGNEIPYNFFYAYGQTDHTIIRDFYDDSGSPTYTDTLSAATEVLSYCDMFHDFMGCRMALPGILLPEEM